MLCFDHVTCYLNQSNEGAYIGYNMNYIKVLEFITLRELRKCYICSQIVMIEKSLVKVE
jgi:riboflavin transporter FmnP